MTDGKREYQSGPSSGGSEGHAGEKYRNIVFYKLKKPRKQNQNICDINKQNCN